MKKYIIILLSFACIGWAFAENTFPPKKTSKSWCWHAEGGFKYPCSYQHTEVDVDDVPATVEVFSKGGIQFCYWSLLGMWSTIGEFPEEGVWVSPTDRVKTITYRAYSKGIASGYTQNGNIYYMKQKIIFGGEVKHSQVLVLIYPPSDQKKVSDLINIVKNW